MSTTSVLPWGYLNEHSQTVHRSEAHAGKGAEALFLRLLDHAPQDGWIVAYCPVCGADLDGLAMPFAQVVYGHDRLFPPAAALH